MDISLFALRRGALLSLAAILVMGLAACSPSESEGSGGNAGGGTVAVVDGEVALGADDLVFDASVIEAPADAEFTITLTNNESQPHNVAIYTEEGGDEIVVGEVITGPDATTETVVPALAPGTYYFRCDVHPEMEGTVVVEG